MTAVLATEAGVVHDDNNPIVRCPAGSIASTLFEGMTGIFENTLNDGTRVARLSTLQLLVAGCYLDHDGDDVALHGTHVSIEKLNVIGLALVQTLIDAHPPRDKSEAFQLIRKAADKSDARIRIGRADLVVVSPALRAPAKRPIVAHLQLRHVGAPNDTLHIFAELAGVCAIDHIAEVVIARRSSTHLVFL